MYPIKLDTEYSVGFLATYVCDPYICLLYTSDVIKEPLTCLDIEHVVRAEEKEPMIQQNLDEYECFVRGQIFLEDSMLKIGGIEISIEGHYYPKDIRDKEFVEMEIGRVDIG